MRIYIYIYIYIYKIQFRYDPHFSIFNKSLNPRLGGGNGMKKIILEQSSIHLFFGVLMDGIESPFPYLRV